MVRGCGRKPAVADIVRYLHIAGLCGLERFSVRIQTASIICDNICGVGRLVKQAALVVQSRLQSVGRNERIRTSDPFVPNEVRYRAALHSE